MHQPGNDPTRRNRNIGTKSRGWKKQSNFVIPERWEDWNRYYEKLENPVVVTKPFRSTVLEFIIEPPRDDCMHVCTPDDIGQLLYFLPENAVKGLDGIILRQPTRKQSFVNPVWARLCYFTEAGDFSGSAIFIEALPRDWKSFEWNNKQSLENQQEIRRMDCLIPGRSSNRRTTTFDFNSMYQRRWLLYHTLIHEVGHWVDYLTKVKIPRETDPDTDYWDRYWQRPTAEREAFAHRFSDEWRDELIRRWDIPFPRMIDEFKMKKQGLDPKWFEPTDPGENEAGPKISKFFAEDKPPADIPPT